MLAELDPLRVAYYQNQVKQFQNYGKSFLPLAEDHPTLVRTGDELISSSEATGYNIVLDKEVERPQSCIIYREAVWIPEHFALLLATMERKKLIQADQVDFGISGVRVLYSGWETAAHKSTIGGLDVLDYVATTVALTPPDDEKAKEIADFLNKNTRRDQEGAIPQSPAIPDIRASHTLRDVLPVGKFSTVQTNILSFGNASLHVMRAETVFAPPWRHVSTQLNSDLASYLTIQGVKP